MIGTETVDGATVQLDPKTETEVLETAEEFADLVGDEIGTEAVELFADEKRWIVVADEPVETGRTTVEGDTFESTYSDILDFNVVFADSVETETSGESIALEDLRKNTAEYNETLVRVTDDYQQIAYVHELADGEFTHQVTHGRYSSEPDLEQLPPGQASQWAGMYLTSPDVGEGLETELQDRLGESIPAVNDSGSHHYWVNAETEIDGVVLTRSGEPPQFHVVDQSIASTSVDDLQSLSSGTYDGEVITVEADTTELQISTKESLLEIAPCGPDAVTIGQTCLPILGDAVVHAGVLYEGQPAERDDMLLYAGVSNKLQDRPVETRNERVRVTGELVTAESIDPNFGDHRALVVYDIEPVGTNDDGIPDAVSTYRDELHAHVKEQAETAQGEYLPDSPADEYANESGIVETDGLRGAIDDWRRDNIDTNLLRDVIDYWRSGNPIDEN
ncbi:hypothetical protein CV102_13460 [Natronococcus pandeyae]|uniref:Uncharacterized protein n=1 Tax=Natronococcus pandeyae TaxID=2055836 RepID=A0A8J8Q0J7_9EURY|nr:hypothetical protein [Natronococcus pandeyae]TYL38201.1 hypothetical protein CV102_13460 [Natronococcus pandeyae]